MAIIKFQSPLVIRVSNRKSFIINLNNYRNTNCYVVNKAKKNYTAKMWDQGDKVKKIDKCTIEYIVYRKNKARFDISNIVSITAKFFEDFLVARKILKDDDFTVIVGSSQRFGGVDKENPRVEIIITEVENA